MHDALYSVKEAGAADATARFGAGSLDALRRGARWLFSEHPLPARRGGAGYGRGLTNRAKTVGHVVGDFVREGVVGSPLTVADKLKTHGLGGYYKDFLMPGGSKASLALSLAMPALDAYRAATAPEGERGAAIGRAVGDFATMPLTARLGIPGQLLLREPVARLGARVGRALDPQAHTDVTPSAPELPPFLRQHAAGAPPEDAYAPPYTVGAHSGV